MTKNYHGPAGLALCILLQLVWSNPSAAQAPQCHIEETHPKHSLNAAGHEQVSGEPVTVGVVSHMGDLAVRVNSLETKLLSDGIHDDRHVQVWHIDVKAQGFSESYDLVRDSSVHFAACGSDVTLAITQEDPGDWFVVSVF